MEEKPLKSAKAYRKERLAFHLMMLEFYWNEEKGNSTNTNNDIS